MSSYGTKLARRKPTPKQRDEKIMQLAAKVLADGKGDQYCWFVRLVVPPQYWQDLTDDGDDRIACWPGVMFPVIRFNDDPYGDYADVLVETFRYSNERTFSFYRMITTVEILNQQTPGRWYPWGELVFDQACEYCGQIYRVNVLEEWLGCDCRSGIKRVSRAYIDGIMYQLENEHGQRKRTV